jgi:hypothetical protein
MAACGAFSTAHPHPPADVGPLAGRGRGGDVGSAAEAVSAAAHQRKFFSLLKGRELMPRGGIVNLDGRGMLVVSVARRAARTT